MRVTFYSSRLDMRISRVALAAKAAGVALQLIVPKGIFNWNLPCPSPFDEVACFDGCEGDYKELFALIHRFNSDLAHLFVSHYANRHALALVAAPPVPIVGDAYDLMHAQYRREGRDKSFFQELVAEQFWLRRVHGLCLRSKYVKLLKEEDNYCCGKQVLLFPEPLISSFMRSKTKLSSYDGRVHVLSIVDHSLAGGETAHFERILKAALSSDVVFHVLQWPYVCISRELQCYLKRRFGNIFFYEYMDFTRYTNFMAKMDLVIQNTDFYKTDSTALYLVYRQEACPFFFSNKINEVIENNSVYGIPAVFASQYRYAAKARRGLAFARGELESPSFWIELPGRLREMYAVSPVVNRLNERYQGARLRRFYEKVRSSINFEIRSS